MTIVHHTAHDGTFSATGATVWEEAHDGLAGDGGFAFKYTFNTGTGANPTTGQLQFNNATPASVTSLSIYETDASGVAIDIYLDEFDEGDWLMVSNQDRSKFIVFIVNDQFVSGVSIDNVPVLYQFGTTLFANGETVFLSRQIGEFKYKLGRIFAFSSDMTLL